ncbi:radical SAM protein [Candidatus Kuenenbacteria bacterium]|nr:radical SAM protein [Candidatus Kuenenbacteria bacterium]
MKTIHDIPIVFSEKFPSGFDNRIQNWGFFTREEIENNQGKLLTLDFDFGRFCSLKCPDCFRKVSVIDELSSGDLSYDQMLAVIDQAVDLGLRTVKVCGKGEPTEDTRFLQFVRDMSARGVGLAVFTAGQVLGDDEKARVINRDHGIRDAKHLCEELFKLNVSFMLKFQSFDSETQDLRVGKDGHTAIRDQALINLVEAGFADEFPTRLATCSNPINKLTANEVFDIYVWSRQRNIYPITAALMVSGKQIDKQFLQENDISDDEKIQLWTQIYEWNIEHGLQTLGQIEREQISVLPGMHPCNQIAVGLYVSMTGNVLLCPGSTVSLGNVEEESLEEIWQRQVGRLTCPAGFNCFCPPKDGVTIPLNLYEQVLANLRSK